jgi:hypothetical protein
MKNLKQRLINNNEFINFINDRDDDICLWFNNRTNNFCLELNAELIKATKTFKPIEDKLNNLGCLEELI